MAADVFADGGYGADKLPNALTDHGGWIIEIVKRSDMAERFDVIPKPWVGERTFAWLGRCRRLAKDFEACIESAAARVLLTHVRLITRRLARA